jgi:formylmethanofuran dehydrogenase subunit E-like metal-binding protein
LARRSAIFALAVCTQGFSSGLAIAQEREWSWDMTDEDAYLVFGTPNTDDVGISFWCKMGSGKIKVFVPSTTTKKNSTKEKITFAIEGDSYALNGEVEPSEDMSVAIVETETNWDHPLFSKLTSADVVSVTVAGHESRFPLVEANLQDLMKVCKKR